MSYETERYHFTKLSNRGLAVLGCGYQKCHSGHCCGRRVNTDYSVTFVISGKGTYTVRNKTYEITRGQGFMITPDVPHSYTADTKEPWRYIYASFNGVDAKTIIESAGLSDEELIFSFPTDDGMMSILKAMHESGRTYKAKGYDILGYFLLAMSRLIAAENERKQNFSADHYVKLAQAFIEDHFSYNISVEDVADYVGIDRTHLYRLFIKNTGVSPSKFLTDIRLKKAVALMEYDNLSINEIAVSAGFYDLSHFSRIFHNIFGMSPGAYRKEKFKINKQES